MLSGLSSQWSLTLAPMIWEWMGLCKSTLRSIPSCLFGTKRGYSCFHPITVKKKKTALLIIFLSQSHQFPTRCLYQKYFLIGGSGGLFLSRVPQLCQTVKLICQNTTYTSHKMQIRDQSKFRRDIRAKLLHEVCITVKQSFHFYFPHDSIFLSHQPRHWCFSCYLTMQLEQEEAMDLLSGLTLWDTESTTGT